MHKLRVDAVVVFLFKEKTMARRSDRAKTKTQAAVRRVLRRKK